MCCLLFLLACDFTTDERKCTGCVSSNRGRYLDSLDRCLCKCTNNVRVDCNKLIEAYSPGFCTKRLT